MTYGRADRAGCPGARAAGRGNAASLGCCGVRCGLGLDLRRPDIRACPLCSRSPVSAAARSALARNPSASGDTLRRVGKRALMIFRRPPVLVRRRRTADTLLAVADAGLRPSRAPAPAVAARTPGCRRICPPWAPGPAVADLVQARARADGTPRASGFGARPAPGDGGTARDTRPAAIRIRGRYLLCLISIATDVSLHERWLSAGLTLRNSIGIGALGPISLPPKEGLDQWSSEDRAVPAGGSGPASGCLPPGSGAGRAVFDKPRIAGSVRASNHGATTGTKRTRKK